MQINFSEKTEQELVSLSKAADDVLEALRLMGKAQTNTVERVIEHHGTFYEMDHYPPGDVYDEETASQYYYHSHRPESGEHGHFHTFIRAEAIPTEMEPYPYEGDAERPLGEDFICHLIAISMDAQGLPKELFTTNRWVTGETFFSAQDTITLLDKFKIDHVYPCLGTNQWLTAMLRLFRPQIEELLIARDKKIEQFKKENPKTDVFEDEDLEVTSIIPIDIDEQISAIDEELEKRRN